MARDLLSQESVEDILESITALAVTTVEGCEEAGVLLVNRNDHTFSTPAATSDLVRESDRAQFECDEGPCLDAARHQQSFYVEDMANETRWPLYRPRAIELGVGSMMGFELFTYKGALGALDLYSSRPRAFDEHSREIGWVFASHAAVAVAASQREATLQEGYATRQEIGEAVGILMERHRLTSAAAFELLKKASMNTNTKLREIARRITRSGEKPG
ncbi:GAF and ANTAR domain-containing protein [Nocardiopsis ansamitocini]|nr:GAF and ANTAR domain-containing protein [Nocardiopsis ansamitocini]